MILSSNDDSRRATPLLKAALGAVLVCSLIEAPFEVAAAANGVQAVAVVCSKLLLALLVFFACGRAPLARLIALFVCGASVFAVVPALPGEFRYDPIAFVLSTAECVLKSLAIFALLRDTGLATWGRWQRS
ncbi:MAG TPA: hypothetical protein VNE00_10050 [Paraburkholderia sp.]|jgi:hypothetical protein|nr:hypothetical protein [Paraburkholderia sp.]